MQTASQMMAAKKAAKQNAQIQKKAKQNIGAGYGKDRNKSAALKFAQADYRYKLQKGAPADYESRLNEQIKNLLHYQALVYSNDTTSLCVFEKVLRAMNVVAGIYSDKDLLAYCRAADKALSAIREAEDKSPSQRREILKSLLELCVWVDAYCEILPAKTETIISGYCAAVQIALYTTALYSSPKGIVFALSSIIQGKSKFRELARVGKVKESEFRVELLNAAWLFYRIMECFEKSDEPKNISDLNQKAWKEYGDSNYLQAAIRWVMENKLIPFENATGITMIDYREFRNKCIEIEKKFLN